VQRWRNETDPRRRDEVHRLPDSVAKRERLLYYLSGESQRFTGYSDAVRDVVGEKSWSIFHVRNHGT